MLFVLSPAKSLDFDTPATTSSYSQSDFLDQSTLLNQRLRELSAMDLAELMKLSMKLAELNFERNIAWQPPFTPDNAKPAVLAFTGDVYTGLAAPEMDEAQLQYLQKHLRILSGLYGLLKPLDLIQAYRLEMGTRLSNSRGNTLYQFWDNRITEHLNQLMAEETAPVLVNLASNEYFKAVKPKQLDARVVTPVFKDCKNGQYKVISFYAKKARGMMVRFAADKRITDVEDLKAFDYAGYQYDDAASKQDEWVFTRPEQV